MVMDSETPGPIPQYVEGAATENPPQGDAFQAVDVPLPPGTHPFDPSVAWNGGNLPDATAAPADAVHEPGPRGRVPFSTDNGAALAVYQRGDHDWSANRIVVDVNNGGSVQAVGRQRGRAGVILSVPTGGLGVVFAPSEGEVLNAASCPQLLPGGSILISTEAPVWVGLIGVNATGTVDVICTYNAPGGGLGTFL